MSRQLETLLEQLRAQFLDGLEERLQRLEHLALALDQDDERHQRLQALYREVHSLKGLGGTHGLPLLSAACHALENRLETLTTSSQTTAPIDAILAYLDLLRDIGSHAREGRDDAPLRARLERLEDNAPHALVVEPSATLAALMEKMVRNHGLRVTRLSDGLEALGRLLHQPFHLLLCARHLGSLDAPALLAALRLQEGPNQGIATVLISAADDWEAAAPRPDRLIIRRSDFLLQLDQALQTLRPAP